MLRIDLSHLIYIFMEAYLVGGVAFVLWAFHFRFLWRHRKTILMGTLIVTAYALPLDAIAVARGWGGFNPTYVSGIYFFGGSLLLEEVLFWLGTSFVTISAVLIFAELEQRGTPRWLLAAGVFLPIEIFDSLIRRRSTRVDPSSEERSNSAR